jgi:hypothetical protein
MHERIRAPENGQNGPETGQKALWEGFEHTSGRLTTSKTGMIECSMSGFSTAW